MSMKESVLRDTPSTLATPDFAKLHLFTTSGATFTFHQVSNVHVLNETTLTFNYVAKSDLDYKHATILLRNLVGWSVVN